VRAGARAGDDISTVRLPIDIRRFPWIRRLAADYAFDYARVAEFFAGNPADPAAWRGAIARAQQQPRHREAVAQILEAQQRKRGAPPEALSAAARLRDPRPTAWPIYLGDDVSDEQVFKRWTGASVAVGQRRRTAARYFVKSPPEVAECLERLDDLYKMSRQRGDAANAARINPTWE